MREKDIKEKKLPNRQIVWITLVIITNMLTFWLTGTGIISLPDTVTIRNSSDEFRSELVKINELNNVIQKYYLRDADEEALGEAAIKAMFEALGDKYSEYYPKSTYESISNSMSGTFGGVGVIFTKEDDGSFLVNGTVSGSPVEKAGVQKGDTIVKVNGESVADMDTETLMSKTRGEIGTELTMTFDRSGTQTDYKLKREQLNEQTILSANQNGIGYIYVAEFGEGTAADFEKALKELESQNVTGLVIDLRDNPGGLVKSAVSIGDLLMDKGELGYATSKSGKKDAFTTTDGKTTLPVVVLVNENTASAAELLSGGLQKAGAAKIIGTTTYGKGVIQGMSSLSDGSGYKLTIQEYFLSDGTQVNEKGITPDIVVEETEDMKNGTMTDLSQDVQLTQALDTLKAAS